MAVLATAARKPAAKAKPAACFEQQRPAGIINAVQKRWSMPLRSLGLHLALRLAASVAVLAGLSGLAIPSATAATVVALGASNTYGKGVARSEAYPAQLQAILRAKGVNVHVVNAGINGDTTEGMLNRLDRVVPGGTSAVILQPGGNDRRKRSADRTGEIENRLHARGIPMVMLPNSALSGLPHQPDGQHLTPEGYHMLAEEIAPQVMAAIGH
ncbi:GDSL-type esterase/lipase family protein [Bradyrhizobium sp.]|uniref:GDSL-type esterase/lipase family protein n=1 Tax=Bradyrhizobium sp. TaxID=376 RepID=UPI003C33E66A